MALLPVAVLLGHRPWWRRWFDRRRRPLAPVPPDPVDPMALVRTQRHMLALMRRQATLSEPERLAVRRWIDRSVGGRRQYTREVG